MTLGRATPAQLPGICRALEAAGLPTSDLTPAKLEHFLTGQSGDAITHVAGLELFGDAGLVRSLFVAEGQRRAGQASLLLAALEAHARVQGVRALYLLTTTAARFFARHGYAVIERDRAPAALQATAEFAALCPASATCMTKTFSESDA